MVSEDTTSKIKQTKNGGRGDELISKIYKEKFTIVLRTHITQ